MYFKRLITTENELFFNAMKLYKNSFPLHEQRKSYSQSIIMNNDEYNFNLIYDKNILVGIILFWETDAFIYVEHFCIFPEMRNQKYGKKTLELLSQKNKTVILEIDPPIDNVSIRRKIFYERESYKANTFNHIHPPYREEFDGHSLIIMSSPNLLSEKEYAKFKYYLKNTVMLF